MVDLYELAVDYLSQMEKLDFHFLQTECNRGELAAFIGFAVSFPTSFLALVDTYNVLKYILASRNSLLILFLLTFLN